MLSDANKARCIDTFNLAPPLQASFPITLSNGARVSAVRGVCSRCQCEIDPADVHGRVTWPIPAVAVVDASGLCRPCSTMTEVYVRLRPSGNTYRAEAPMLDGRGWVAVQPPPIPWWSALRRLLMRIPRQ